MRRIFLIATLALCSSGAAMADTVGRDLYDMGREYCGLSFTRAIGSFDVGPIRQAIEAGDGRQDHYCKCVGTQFREMGDDEMAASLREEIAEDAGYEMMASFLAAAAPACVPEAEDPGLGLDLGLSDEDLEGDLFQPSDNLDATIADNDFAGDPGDVHACLLAFDDAMMLPGFDPARELARVKAAGQSREDVCSCAGAYISSLGEPFQAEVEAAQNPQVIYGSALAGGISLCING